MAAIGLGLWRRVVHLTVAASAACAVVSAAASPVSAADPVRPASRTGSGSTDVADARLVARIAAQLAVKAGVRTTFRQTQTLAALSAPLVSTGTLVFAREHGVIWRTETPYRVTYVIGDAGVTKVDAGGRQSTRAAPRGGVAQVSQMMRAMLGGDLSALYSQFDVAAAGTPARWHVLLTPNQPQLAQAVKALRMEGGMYLQTLEITAANGDTTRIAFSGSEGIDALSPAELALFGAH
ncbi:outer membrane lipoprotein carrier protein LolA [Paraburkholderia sp. T12-10]|nr:outer membrane lipoprotein carrier protein LolA [Paraburkholderia sp. T12-10]